MGESRILKTARFSVRYCLFIDKQFLYNFLVFFFLLFSGGLQDTNTGVSITVTGHLHQNFLTCSLIVMLHKYIVCFDLEMYFLIDNNMTTTVVAINKLMHLVKF